jgi:hypothetical protein
LFHSERPDRIHVLVASMGREGPGPDTHPEPGAAQDAGQNGDVQMVPSWKAMRILR